MKIHWIPGAMPEVSRSLCLEVVTASEWLDIRRGLLLTASKVLSTHELPFPQGWPETPKYVCQSTRLLVIYLSVASVSQIERPQWARTQKQCYWIIPIISAKVSSDKMGMRGPDVSSLHKPRDLCYWLMGLLSHPPFGMRPFFRYILTSASKHINILPLKLHTLKNTLESRCDQLEHGLIFASSEGRVRSAWNFGSVPSLL